MAEIEQQQQEHVDLGDRFDKASRAKGWTDQHARQPQDDSETVIEDQHSGRSRVAWSTPSETTTEVSLLPRLDRIRELTMQIQDRLDASEDSTDGAQHGDDNQELSVNAPSLVVLLCQRAAVLLEQADFDASAMLSAASNHDDNANDQGHGGGVVLVQQALEDALSAVAADARSALGWFLAAQSARSLGRPAKAREFAMQAHRLAPDSTTIASLARQLQVDLDDARFDAAPPLLLSRATRNINVERKDHHRQQYASADLHGVMSTDDIQRCRELETIADSELLHKMERMRHQNVHHQCAGIDDDRALSTLMASAAKILRDLLQETEKTSHALALDAIVMDQMAARMDTGCALAEITIVRRWLTKIFAPAVAQRVGQHPLDNLNADKLRAVLLRDILLVLARLLLASGNRQLCTRMPHALTYIKTSYDLAKQLALHCGTAMRFDHSMSEEDEHAMKMLQLEMTCADAYAVGLLELTDEAEQALLLHQESLDIALASHDSFREMLCRHYLARALLQTGEYDLAHTECLQLLQQSQHLHDKSVECLAWYELGQYFATLGNFPKAMTHFQRARTICNQTAQCQSTWRAHSIECAMEFYGCMTNERRPAMVPMRRMIDTHPTPASQRYALAPRQAAWSSSSPSKPPSRRNKPWPRMHTPTEARVISSSSSSSSPSSSSSLAWIQSGGQQILRALPDVDQPLKTYRISLLSWLIGKRTRADAIASAAEPACLPRFE